MITLAILTYIIISLCIAWRKYNQMFNYFDDSTRVSKYYGKGRKSLLYGFFFLPGWGIGLYVTAMIIIGIFKAFIFTIGWIVTNMP